MNLTMEIIAIVFYFVNYLFFNLYFLFVLSFINCVFLFLFHLNYTNTLFAVFIQAFSRRMLFFLKTFNDYFSRAYLFYTY